MKIGCEEWKKVYPYCGWDYIYSGWWEGWHQEEFSRFLLPGLKEGDRFKIRFVTHTLDGNANCTQDGYHGWQIFDAIIADDL
jgi:hypothetical protein